MRVMCGDALEGLRELEDESVQCCVTSPPYWGLRDYGTAAWEGGEETCDHTAPIESGASGNKSNSQTHPGRFVNCKCGAKRIDSQLGLEKTPEEYVAKMVEIFREVRRVLRKDGTLWLNLGDSYAGAGGLGAGRHWDGREKNVQNRQVSTVPLGFKSKDLMGIPWRVAFALQADGWWLRSDIIWAKPNPMPESVTDRPTKSHEYLFLLTKSATYFYDAEAIKEPHATAEHAPGNKFHPDKVAGPNNRNGHSQWEGDQTRTWFSPTGRNKRSVWTVATAPYPEAHFATYPPDLIKPCILAGTSAKGCCAKCGAPWERVVESERWSTRPGNEIKFDASRNDNGRNDRIESSTKTLGWQPTCKCREVTLDDWIVPPTEPCTVLDPFAGSGTTGMVALELGRKAILIELNPKYVALIEQRCDVTLGLQLA